MRKVYFAGIALLCLAAMARAYPVGPAPLIEDMADKSDAVVKVKAVGSVVVAADPWFTDYSKAGFYINETTFTVISSVKGDVATKEFHFRHYDYAVAQPGGFTFMPQNYHFEPGKTYLVFANKSDQPGIYRQLWLNHTMQDDRGVWRCADDKPLPATITPKESLWHELVGMTESKDALDVIYGLSHLDLMSSPDFRGTKDFNTFDVINVFLKKMSDPKPEIATAAISMVGRESPFIKGPNSFILVRVAKNPFVKRGTYVDPAIISNGLGQAYTKDLLAIAVTKDRDSSVRALAIRAFAFVKDKAVYDQLPAWTADPSPDVRAAAAILWSELPTKESTSALIALAADQQSAVRCAAGYAMACSQRVEFLPALDKLLDDAVPDVREAGVMGILSMEITATTPTLTSRLKDPRYTTIFTLDLADAQPAAHRDDLAKILIEKPKIDTNYISQMLIYAAWEILQTDLATHSANELSSPAYAKYLDAIEEVPQIGSGPYQTLYTMYWEKGLKTRAATFREKALKQANFDIDYYFKTIDGRGN